MTPAEREALGEYVSAVRRDYGARVVDILIFGSRARGDERPDSDADVAVVLEDGEWRFWTEKMRLSGLAYDVLLKHGLYIQPWPIGRMEWEAQATYPRRRLIEAIRKEGRQLTELT